MAFPISRHIARIPPGFNRWQSGPAQPPHHMIKDFLIFTGKVVLALAVYKAVKTPIVSALPASTQATVNSWLP